MKLSLRFVVPLLIVLAALALAAMPLVDRLTLRWFIKDLDLRASLVANTIEDPLQRLVAEGDAQGLGAYLTRITQDERLYAVGFCQSGRERPDGRSSPSPRINARIPCTHPRQLSCATTTVISEITAPSPTKK